MSVNRQELIELIKEAERRGDRSTAEKALIKLESISNESIQQPANIGTESNDINTGINIPGLGNASNPSTSTNRFIRPDLRSVDSANGGRLLQSQGRTIQDRINATPSPDTGFKRALNETGALVGTMGTGMLSTPAGGIAGLGTLIATGDPEQALQAQNKTIDMLTYDPNTQQGQDYVGKVGEAFQPVTDTLQGIEDYSAQTGYEVTDSPAGAAAFSMIPEGAAMLAGGGALRAFRNKSVFNKDVAEQIEAGGTSKELAPYMTDGAGNVSNDPLAKEVIRQGYDQRFVQAVKQSSKTDKAKMKQMTEVAQAINKDYFTDMRPADIAGKSLTNRLDFLEGINKSARDNLDAVAKTLKGKSVDFSQPIDNFVAGLDKAGIKLDRNNKPIFEGSDIEDLTGLENAVQRLMNRMTKGKLGVTPDGYDIHRLKKYIDENVSYGKGGDSGLSGKVEGLFKKLRHDLDSTLDSQFPQYDKINRKYSETRTAMDSLQTVAGKKMQLFGPNADKALGTLLRRLMSNAQSRIPLLDSLELIEKTTSNYGGRFRDNISIQAQFADGLEAVIDPVAHTSFKGDIGRETTRVAKQNLAANSLDLAEKGINKFRKINQDAALEAMIKLLSRQRN